MTAKYCHVFCEYTWQSVKVRSIYLIFCNSWFSRWPVQYKRNSKADKKCYSIHLLVQNQQPETLQKRCEICSKLSIKTPKRRHSVIFIVNFENIPHLFLGFLLLTLNTQISFGKSIMIVIREHGKKMKFSIKYFLSKTKSARNCGFGHI